MSPFEHLADLSLFMIVVWTAGLFFGCFIFLNQVQPPFGPPLIESWRTALVASLVLTVISPVVAQAVWFFYTTSPTLGQFLGHG